MARFCQIGKPELLSDLCQWIDTAVMVADCLAKSMKEDFLLNVVETNDPAQNSSSDNRPSLTGMTVHVPWRQATLTMIDRVPWQHVLL